MARLPGKSSLYDFHTFCITRHVHWRTIRPWCNHEIAKIQHAAFRLSTQNFDKGHPSITKYCICHELDNPASPYNGTPETKVTLNITKYCICHDSDTPTSPMVHLPAKVTFQHHQIVRLPRKGQLWFQHISHEASFAMADNSSMMWPWNCKTEPVRSQSLFFLPRHRSLCSGYLPKFHQFFACHEQWHCNITKYCTSHEKWHPSITK